MLNDGGDPAPPGRTRTAPHAGRLVTFVAQSAACAQFHTVRERASRWVLLLHDRAAVDEFPITHEWLARMLGAQRLVVTVALREGRKAHSTAPRLALWVEASDPIANLVRVPLAESNFERRVPALRPGCSP